MQACCVSFSQRYSRNHWYNMQRQRLLKAFIIFNLPFVMDIGLPIFNLEDCSLHGCPEQELHFPAFLASRLS